MDSDNRIKALIKKYIDQHCTPEELEELKKIISLPSTQHLFEEVISENYAGLVREDDIDQPHLNEKLQKFYTKVDETEGTRAKIRSIKRTRYLYHAAVWAIMIIGVGTYGLFKYSEGPVKQEVVMQVVSNPLGQRSKIMLPDSSEVYLGAGSSLSMPNQFAGNTREVKLVGEAFFQVTKNPKKPFIIHTGTVQTRVLGTSFKIDAFNGSPLTVSVATGKVRVDEYGEKTPKSLAVLIPGQKITYQNHIAVTTAIEATEVSSWKDARLFFHNRRLKEITAELERWYAVKINFNDQAKASENITIELQADVPLNKIMKVLSATGHFKYTINGKTINIK